MLKKLKRSAKGVNVPHEKGAAGLATLAMPVPATITLPMQQHIGAPANPVVKKGDTVYLGTLVGEAAGPVSVNIHSGVSGTVKAVEKIRSTTGKIVDAVVIEADGEQTVDPALQPPTVRDRESFLEAVRSCGLVGLGGAGFPTAVKLAPKNPEKIDTLVINAAECEPYIATDTREMLECGDTILSGIMATLKYLEIGRAIIAVERNKPEAMDLMFSLTKGEAKLSVAPLPVNYPQGAEKVLIEAVTGREVPQGGLPADAGVLVMNITTVSTIGKYLQTGVPLVTRRITVDGGAVAEPKNVDVVIGTAIQEVLDFCGVSQEKAAKIICGGPMMGVAMADTAYPIVKQNNALTCLTAEQLAPNDHKPCIRCGSCIKVCPVGLSPIEITEAYELRNNEELEKLHCDICMSCGCCSYICPAKRLVSQTTTLARGYYLKGANKA